MSIDGFEKMSAGIKDALEAALMVTVIGFVILLACSPGMQHMVARGFASLSSAGIKSLKIGELEIDLKEAKQETTEAKLAAITIANNPPAAPANQLRSTPQDKAPSPNLAPALEAVSISQRFWIYVGQTQANKFLHPPNFNANPQVLPKEGDRLTATTDTYERDAAPTPDRQQWKLGRIVGVVREGQRVIVRQVNVVPDENIWLYAEIDR